MKLEINKKALLQEHITFDDIFPYNKTMDYVDSVAQSTLANTNNINTLSNETGINRDDILHNMDKINDNAAGINDNKINIGMLDRQAKGVINYAAKNTALGALGVGLGGAALYKAYKK